MYAIVEGDQADAANRTFRKAIGFTEVTRSGAGAHTLTAIDNLSGCAVVPAISTSDTLDGVNAGLIITADAGFTNGTVNATIRNEAGTPVNEDFTVTC